MASTAPAVPATQLCDYCHQKPKHGTYAYCSKTCAAQTQTLCNHCQKKPKFQNFEYCGKNCASQAAAVAGGNRAATAKNTNSASKPQARSTTVGGTAAGLQASTGANPNPLLDPLQIAKLVAQHIPQVQSFLAAVTQPAGAAPPPAYVPQAPPAPAAAPVPVPGPASTPSPAPANPQPPAVKQPPRNNPFLNVAQAVLSSASPNASAGAGSSSGNSSSSTAPPAQPLDCLIPGCGKPVHVDASGAMSDYCSQKHREEAVSSGLVSPCIMCLTRPQSDTDYFCGRDCREEAMNKPADP